MKKLFLAAILLRVALLAFVLASGHWSGGDTNHYVWIGGEVCKGNWGGVPGRPSLYAWYLCVLSPHIDAGLTAARAALPLLVQSALTLLCALLFSRLARTTKSRILVAAFILFDPVLLAYSNLVMSDALFAVITFALVGTMWATMRLRRPWLSVAVGAELAALILTRSVGFPFALWTGLVFAYANRKNPKAIATVLLTALVCLAPQSYWNKTRHGSWSVTQQGDGWLRTVAAAVEFNGTGVDFYEAEARWVREKRDSIKGEVPRILLHKFPTFAWLSFKGVARVLVGHVNVEWGGIFLGTAPVGPGWFKVPEPRPGPKVTGGWVIVWLLGIVLAATMAIAVYARAIRAVIKRKRLDLMSVWLVGSIALLALVPLVWGDARFRLPVLPLALGLWIWNEINRS